LDVENDQAAVLRQRGAALVKLSLTLMFTPATMLVFRAGTGTWVGPTPARCQDELDRLRRELLRAADDLAVQGRRLLTQADLLDMASRAGPKVLVR
jgi:hypothetical protein